MKILYNPVMEFYCFLSTYIMEKIAKEKETQNIPSDERLTSIMNEIDVSISPFLKHDLELFFHKMFLSLWMVFHIILQEELEEEESLFTYLESLSEKEFLFIYQENLHLGDKAPETITQKEINKGIEMNFFHPGRSQAKLISQLFASPGEWKPRIIKSLQDFYTDHYRKYREELLTVSRQRCQKAEVTLKENPIYYLDTVTLGHYQDILEHSEDVLVIFSYTFDRNLTLSIKRKILLIGLTREQLLTSAKRRLQTNIFFNALSDQKRIDILRLLKEREWFSNELAKHFGITPATMSYHLGKLIEAGLVNLRLGDQKKAYYQVNRERVSTYLRCALADLIDEGSCEITN